MRYGEIDDDHSIDRHSAKSYENANYLMVHRVFGKSNEDKIPTAEAVNKLLMHW